MKQKHLLKSLLLLIALVAGGSAWAQSDKSSDYTGNVTLSVDGGTSASVCEVTIGNTKYNGIKAGTGKAAGAVIITVPANTKYLHLHVAGWNNESVTLAVTPTGYSEGISLTADSGISGNSPFTFSGNASTSDYYKVITFSSALTEETAFTFTATGGKRFVVWGVTAEEESTTPITPICATPTFSPEAGAVVSGTTVTITSATEGATIYYTIDGTDPSSNSSIYSEPIEITAATTIKAFASKSDYDDSEVATAAYTIKQAVKGYTIDFESDIDDYVDWTFDNIGNTNNAIKAHGGSKYGANINDSGNGVATAYIQTKEPVANPGVFTCYVSKTSNNTTASTWKVQVSADGSEWTDVETASAVGMSKGEWNELTADLSAYNNVYVRLYYDGSTAIRAVDDITITEATPKVLSSIALSGDYPTVFHVGDEFSHEGVVVTATYEDGKTADVTSKASFSAPDMTSAGTKAVTVSYTEGQVTKEATYDITVNTPATLVSIVLSGNYPTEFQQGDAFSSEGITVTANYDDQTTKDVTEDASFSGYDMSVLGEQTVTVTYEGKTATYAITVVEKKGTADNPYTVAQARAAIDANSGVTGVYATGIVSEIVTAYNSQYGNITYNISADGSTTADQLQAYRGKGENGANFTSADDIQVGDVVVVYGNLTKYNDIYEFAQNNQLVSLQRVWKPATPTISPAEGTFYEAQNVTISCETEDADIYYTIEARFGGEVYNPESVTDNTLYSKPISLGLQNYSLTYTIRAYAEKDGKKSDVAETTITIDLQKYVVVTPLEINLGSEGGTGTLSVSFINYPDYLRDTAGFHYWKRTDTGTQMIDNNIPEWFHIEYSDDYSTLTYTVDPNTTTEKRDIEVEFWVKNTFSDMIHFTQEAIVLDYAELPFEWEGGASTDFLALNGVTAEGLGSDYAAVNAPYNIKFDTTGDYIQVKTDGQIFNVTLDVKMIGGSNASTITVQGSADGEQFTDVQELSISGAQNDVLNLETSNAFAADYRYVRLVFTKGSNVGVGGITINLVKKSISDAGYATYYSPYALDFTDSGLTAYVAIQEGNNVKFSKVTTVPANTGVLLKGETGDYTINVVEGGAAGAMQNLFQGVLVDTEKEDPIYVLLNGDAGVGFYKTTQGFTVGAHTAYLPATAGGNGARSFIAIDEATAIESIAAETMTNGEVYNLQGQRVVKAQKGLYIINGKKVVIK